MSLAGVPGFPQRRRGPASAGLRRWLLIAILLAPATPLPAATFTVSNCTDGGAGSLRQAILDANGAGGTDAIVFSVACIGSTAIRPASSLPTITGTVTIDGCSAPGAICGVTGGLIAGTPLTLRVEIDAVRMNNVNWFRVNAAGSTVRGLVIHHSQSHGIRVTAAGAVLQFNYIGVSPAGDASMGNASDGIRVDNANNVVIRDNVIAGSTGAGVRLDGNTANNLVTGNIIGIDATQTLALDGDSDGVRVDDATTLDDSIIGNVIGFSISTGLELQPSGNNLNDPDDVDSGPNNLQNFPVLASATRSGSSTTFAGTLDTDAPNTDFRIDVFANNGPDRTGYGEGERFLGSFTVTTNGSGDAAFSTAVPVCDPDRDDVAATATRLSGGVPLSTSEFSASIAAGGSCGVAGNVDLALGITDSPDPVRPDSALTYTLTVSNRSATGATNVSVVHNLPAGVTFASAVGGGWACGEAGGVVTCTRAALAASSTAPAISVVVTAPASEGPIATTATVSGVQTDPVDYNSRAAEATTVTRPSSDLRVLVADSPDPVGAGGTLTYTLSIDNLGPSTATSLVVSNVLPAGAVFSSATGTGWSCNEAGGIVTCTRPSLAAGSAPAITITVTAPGTAQYLLNAASVTSAVADADASNNDATERTAVGSPSGADLGIVKLDGPDPVRTSSVLSYTLRVTNHGPLAASSVVVTDTLPAGVAFLSSSGSGWGCGEGGGVVTCSRPALPVGPAPEIAIQVTTPAIGGGLTNVVSVAATENDPFTPNNSDSAATTVITDPSTIDLCYAVADSGNRLVSIGRDAPHAVAEVGYIGVTNVEAVAFGPGPGGTPLLYASNDYEDRGVLGTLDLATGVFREIGPHGIAGGALGELPIIDVDGLAFHPQTLELWGQQRTVPDSLFRVDPATGAHVPDVFGPGVDYLVIDFAGSGGGAACLENEMDSVAISLDGRWFVQVDYEGTNQQFAELELDANGIPTGRLLSCVDLVDTFGVPVEDMEGTNFDHTGELWGTTGNVTGGPNDNRLWKIDYNTAVASHPSTGSSPGAPFGIWDDYEGSDCRVPDVGINTLDGTVFFDDDGDGLLGAGEAGWSNVTVRLYLDRNADGQVDAGDELLQTTVTDWSGAYSFKVMAGGPYVIDIDTSTLPASTALTTDNVERAIFGGNGFRDPGNDFGFESTTPAFVTSFGVYDDGGIPVLEWQTASEVGTLGFYVDRWDPAEARWVPLNERLLPAALAPQGGYYRLAADRWPEETGAYYALREVEESGRQRSHGPFFARLAGLGGRVPLAGDYEARARPPSRRLLARFERARAAARDETRTSTRQSIVYELTPAKLFVNERNLYFVSSQDLARSIGLSPDEVEAMIATDTLDVLSGGLSMPVLPAPGGLYFYGEPADSVFTRENVYYAQAGWARRMGPVNGRPWGPADSTSFRDVVRFEEEHFAGTVVSTNPLEDFWYWRVMVAGDPMSGLQAFDLDLPDLSGTSRSAELAVEVTGVSISGVAGEHHLAVRINGADVGEQWFEGRGRRTLRFPVTPGVLRSGTNQVEIEGLLDGDAPYSVVYVNALEVAYDRAFRAVGDRLLFEAESAGEVTVSGFGSQPILVFDVSDPLWVRSVQGTVTDFLGGGYRMTFRATAGQRYLAVSASGVSSPVRIDRRSFFDLRAASGAEYLVIAPRRLVAAAERLAEHRRQQGLSALVVTLEDVYDQFAHGLVTPLAIRDLLVYAYGSWPVAPRYAVLVGAGTLDYYDALGYGGNLVPPLLAATPHGLFASDLMLGDVAGSDGIPEIAVGRIPVLTEHELLDYAAKVERFEEHASAGDVVLLADDADGGGGDFPRDSDALLASLAGVPDPQRIYLSELPLAEARSQLFAALDAGAYWVNYLGHGGVDRLAAEGLLTNADVPALENSIEPVVSAFTCVIGRFEVPGFASLAGELVLEPEGGATAVFAPTGLSLHRLAARLDQALLRAVFSRRLPTLGDAVLEAFRELAMGQAPSDLLEIYALFGDPALRLW